MEKGDKVWGYKDKEEAANEMIEYIKRFEAKPERQAEAIFGGSVEKFSKFAKMAEEVGIAERLALDRV